jgi:hypothetical protein
MMPVTAAVPHLAEANDTHLRRLTLVVCVAVAALTALFFFPAVFNGWAPFDDEVQLLDNERIRALTADNLRWMFTDTHLTLRYTPLSWIIWTAIYPLTGAVPPSPWPFHVLGLVCHVVNAGLVCWLIAALLRQWGRVGGPSGPEAGTRGVLIAGLVAALWAMHPLRVEVASWATQARFAEAMIPAILSLLLYMRAVTRERGGLLKSPAFWGSVVLYWVSILIYPSTICLPLVLPLLDVYLFRRAPAGRRLGAVVGLFLEKWPYIPVAVVVGILTVYGRAASATTFWGPPATLTDFPLHARLMQACYVIMYFVWKPLDPTHLSPVYSDLIGPNLWRPQVVIASVLFVAVSCAVWVLRKRLPWLLVLWAAHVLILLPVSGLMDRDFLPADRYAYLHDVVWAAGIAGVLLWAWPRATRLVRQLVPAAGIAAVLAFGLLSRAQTQVWRDPYTLFDHIFAELGEDPYRRFMYMQLARWLARDGRMQEALEYCDKALAIDPSQVYVRALRNDVLINLAAFEERQHGPTPAARGLYLEAGRNTDEMLKVSPEVQSFVAAGMMYLHAGELGLAEERLREALRRQPADGNARLSLAQVYHAQGRREEALGELEAAARDLPALVPVCMQLRAAWSAETQPATGPR